MILSPQEIQQYLIEQVQIRQWIHDATAEQLGIRVNELVAGSYSGKFVESHEWLYEIRQEVNVRWEYIGDCYNHIQPDEADLELEKEDMVLLEIRVALNQAKETQA